MRPRRAGRSVGRTRLGQLLGQQLDAHWWRPLRAAFAFLTRLPVGRDPPEAAAPNPPAPETPPGAAAHRRAVTEEDLARSVLFFPAVGLALGAACAGVGWLHLAGFLPAAIAAALVVVLLALVTGGLHLDGLADLFDGLAGGRGERDRTLRIMRDSRVGAAGALALLLVVVLQLAAIRELLDHRELLGLLAFPAIARFSVIPQLAFFPYARPTGLGRVFHGRVAVTPLAAESILLVAWSLRLGHGLLVQIATALAVSLAVGFWLTRRLGGLTGDVYGATISLCETVTLLVAALQASR